MTLGLGFNQRKLHRITILVGALKELFLLRGEKTEKFGSHSKQDLKMLVKMGQLE